GFPDLSPRTRQSGRETAETPDAGAGIGIPRSQSLPVRSTQRIRSSSRGVGNRAFAEPAGRHATEGSAGFGPALESGFSRPRSEPALDRAGSYTVPRCRELSARTVDRC